MKLVSWNYTGCTLSDNDRLINLSKDRVYTIIIDSTKHAKFRYYNCDLVRSKVHFIQEGKACIKIITDPKWINEIYLNGKKLVGVKNANN